MKKHKLIKLHLGCYHKKIHGFINIDVRADVKPDLVDDVSELKKFHKNTVDLIYASHVLEHFNRKDSEKTLKCWYEVLKTGGILRVAVPDIQASVEYYLKHGNLRDIQNMLYGSQKHPYDFHYNGWDFETLSEDLKAVGFSKVERYDWRKTEHFYIDDYSQCYLPKIAYQTRRPDGIIEGKLVSLNVEAIK